MLFILNFFCLRKQCPSLCPRPWCPSLCPRTWYPSLCPTCDTHLYAPERDTHLYAPERDAHLYALERDAHFHAPARDANRNAPECTFWIYRVLIIENLHYLKRKLQNLLCKIWNAQELAVNSLIVSLFILMLWINLAIFCWFLFI